MELNNQYASANADGFCATNVLQSLATLLHLDSLSHQSWSISTPHRSVLMMIVFFLKYLETLHLLLDLDVSKSTNGRDHVDGSGVPAVLSLGIFALGKYQILSAVASICAA